MSQQPPPYPPQPPYQQPYYPPPPPPRGGAGGNGKLIAVVAASAVALLAVVGGVYVTDSGGGSGVPNGYRAGPISDSSHGGPAGGDAIRAELLWTATADRPPRAEYGAPVPDAWFTGNAIVKTTPDAVVSYDIDSGRRNWSVPLSGESCPGSKESSDDRIVVQYGTGCARVMAVDIAKGAKLWDKKLPVEDGRTSFGYSQIAVSGETAAVSWLGGASAAYEIGTGKLLRTPKADGNCSDIGYKGGPKLVAVVQCGAYSDPTYYVQGISGSGDKQWTWEVPSHNEVNSVISTDPVVVGLSAGTSSLLSDLVYLEDGKMKSRISLGNPGADAKYRIDCHVMGEGRCQDYAVDSGTIYLSTRLHAGSGSSYRRTNEIAAFDLRTGQAKWLAKPDQEREVTVVGLDEDGGKVIGYQAATYDRPGRLIAVDTTTHTVTPYMELPAAGQEAEDAFGVTGDYLWLYKEHFFVSAGTVRSVGSAGVTGTTAKSVEAFG